MLRAMPPPIAVSKSKLLAFAQCPRKVWLDAYSPELEEASVEKDAALATGNAVGAIAQQLYGADTGHVVSFERGIRAAVEHTRALLAEGGTTPIFEASFDYEGVGVRVDVLDRSAREPRLIEVKASTHIKEHHLQDCAIQAWTLEQLGLPPRQVVIANIDSQFVYAGDGRYEGLLKETDVTDLVRERMAAVPQQVAQLRATLAELDEPAVPVGPQCGAPHGCQFYAHCAPGLKWQRPYAHRVGARQCLPVLSVDRARRPWASASCLRLGDQQGAGPRREVGAPRLDRCARVRCATAAVGVSRVGGMWEGSGIQSERDP
jgi:hypothetical protein